MIFGVQILRGLAAIMVVFAHIESQIERAGGATFPLLNIGVSGVDVFFVISGFIIWVTSQSNRMTIWTFYSRRAIRIIPLYWLVTGFITFVALVAPSLMSSTVFNLTHVIASFGFVPYPHPVLHDPYPILVPGWSLNYEAFFYLLFGMGLLLPKRLLTLFACLGALLVLTACGFLIRQPNYLLYFYTDPIILEFAFGICIGALYTHVSKPPLWVGLAAIPVGIAGIIGAGLADWVNDHHVRFLAVGVPATLLVFGVTVARRYQFDPRLPLLVALGDASYSIYLTHVIVVPVGFRLWAISHLGYGTAQMTLLVFLEVVLAASVGWVVHRLVERPLLEMFRRRPPESGPVAGGLPV